MFICCQLTHAACTQIEAVGSGSGKPSKKVTVADSGELPL